MDKMKIFMGALTGSVMLTACLSSCVKDDETASVTAIRTSKTAYNRAAAQAAEIEANSAKLAAEARAAYLTAQAATKKAEAEYKQAQADLQNAQNAIDKAVAEQNLAKAKAALEASIANYQAQVAQYEYEAAQQAQKLAEAEKGIADDLYKYLFGGTIDGYNYTGYYTQYSTNLQKLLTARNKLMTEQAKLYNLEAGLTDYTEYQNLLIAREEQNIAVYEKQLEIYKASTDKTPAEIAEEYAAANIAANEAYVNYLAATAASNESEMAFLAINGGDYQYYDVDDHTYKTNTYPGKFDGTKLVNFRAKEYNLTSNPKDPYDLTVLYKVSDLFPATAKKYDESYYSSPTYNEYKLTSGSLQDLKTKFNYQVLKNAAVIGTKDDAKTAEPLDPKTGVAFEYSDEGKNDDVSSLASYLRKDKTLYARLADAKERVEFAKDYVKTLEASETTTEQQLASAKNNVSNWENECVRIQQTIDKLTAAYAAEKAIYDEIIAFAEALENPDSDMMKEYNAIVAEAAEAYKVYAAADKASSEAWSVYDVANAVRNSLFNVYQAVVDNYDDSSIKESIEELEGKINTSKKNIDTYKNRISSKEDAIETSKALIAQYESEINYLQAIVAEMKAKLDELLK